MPSPTLQDPRRVRKGKDGFLNHKPLCKCNPCKARRRKAEALAESARTGAPPPPETPPQSHEAFIDPSDPDNIILVKDKSMRGRVAEWAVLRAEGKNNVEIAQILGISKHTLNSYISKATKDGWLKIDDPADRLEHVIAPKIVDNIEYFIDRSQNDAGHALKMTIEGAKGLGLFKSHQALRVEQTSPSTVLALKIETTSSAPSEPVVEGNIIGIPKTLPKPSNSA